ncbi:MAG: hypothetical protein MK033_11475 [Candidatus Caenarcaniphilales bacterium]|nr:hypothetical protein [Candidatus Caenarcaniphilales bacterium]
MILLFPNQQDLEDTKLFQSFKNLVKKNDYQATSQKAQTIDILKKSLAKLMK